MGAALLVLTVVLAGTGASLELVLYWVSEINSEKGKQKSKSSHNSQFAFSNIEWQQDIKFDIFDLNHFLYTFVSLVGIPEEFLRRARQKKIGKVTKISVTDREGELITRNLSAPTEWTKYKEGKKRNEKRNGVAKGRGTNCSQMELWGSFFVEVRKAPLISRINLHFLFQIFFPNQLFSHIRQLTWWSSAKSVYCEKSSNASIKVNSIVWSITIFWNTQSWSKWPRNPKFRVLKSLFPWKSSFPSSRTSWDKYMWNDISRHKF